MAKLSKDFSVGNLHPREVLSVDGLLGALNAEVIVDCDGSGCVMLDMRGTFNLTVEVSGTVDGVNWVPVAMRPVQQVAKAYVAAVAGTAQGVWMGACSGFRRLRARCTAYVSGAAAVTLMTFLEMVDQTLDGMITPLLVTAVGAAGAAVTLTIPAPGAGLRQYLTYLSINRFATALLTAAAAPVTVTTTNIPGTLAFSFAADAMAQGAIDRWREDFAFPLATSALNTATTIVCPATPNVIWRVTAGYYVAP